MIFSSLFLGVRRGKVKMEEGRGGEGRKTYSGLSSACIRAALSLKHPREFMLLKASGSISPLLVI